MNTGVHISFTKSVFVLWGLYIQEWNCQVIEQFYFLFFEKSPYCFPQYMHQLTFPSTVYKGSLFSTFSSVFAMCGLLFSIDSHSDKCSVGAHSALICISWMIISGKHLLMSCWLHSPLGKMSFQFCPFFNQVVFFLMLTCMTCSYILNNNPLLAILVAKYSLPFNSFFFIFHFVDGFLCCAKAFQFNQFSSAYFCFYFLSFRRQIQKICRCDLQFPLGVLQYLVLHLGP